MPSSLTYSAHCRQYTLVLHTLLQSSRITPKLDWAGLTCPFFPSRNIVDTQWCWRINRFTHKIETRGSNSRISNRTGSTWTKLLSRELVFHAELHKSERLVHILLQAELFSRLRGPRSKPERRHATHTLEACKHRKSIKRPRLNPPNSAAQHDLEWDGRCS